jgi:transposase-like protein
MAVSLKGAHFPKDVILTCVRWYVAYLLSYRLVEELRQELESMWIMLRSTGRL